MKRKHRSAVIVAVVVVALGAGCGHSQRRSDWRSPPRACATDADCHAGKCAIELGASQGTCAGGGLPPLPPGDSKDGGSRPPGPAPSIQPSSTDIQI